MFTGIVEETGTIIDFAEGPNAFRLHVRAHAALQQVALGDSIAVNGCCLTVVAHDADSVSFDLLKETVRLTGFASLKPGDPVNLERSLRFNGKIGGHFVTGHIDALGSIRAFEPRGKDHFLEVVPPPEFLKYLVYKGSIAIDGISLTVAEVSNDSFAVWLIPHTLAVTNLKSRTPGQSVNLEFDVLAKYVEKIAAGGRDLRDQMRAH